MDIFYHTITLFIKYKFFSFFLFFFIHFFFFFHLNVQNIILLLGGMYEVNQKSLPEASLRSHQLTKEQISDANNGTLDIITGFTIIDNGYRLIILEGLGAKGTYKIQTLKI